MEIDDGGSINSSSGVVDNTLLAFNVSGSTTFTPPVSGPGGLTQLGSGLVVLGGAATYSGQTTISAGTLQIGAGGSINGTSGIVNNSLLAVNTSNTVTIAGDISGSGGVTQMGPGVLTLTGNNTYQGPTVITGGTLQSVPLLANLPAPVMNLPLTGPAGAITSYPTTLSDVSGNNLNLTLVNNWGNQSVYVPGKFAGTNASCNSLGGRWPSSAVTTR